MVVESLNDGVDDGGDGDNKGREVDVVSEEALFVREPSWDVSFFSFRRWVK